MCIKLFLFLAAGLTRLWRLAPGLLSLPTQSVLLASALIVVRRARACTVTTTANLLTFPFLAER